MTHPETRRKKRDSSAGTPRGAMMIRLLSPWAVLPSGCLLAADACVFAALGGQHVGVARVGVAPPQVSVQFTGLDGVVGMVGVGEGELA
jgi:hypothetical protein